MVNAPEGSRIVHSDFDSIFLRNHDVEAPDLHRLYENAKRDQWNASVDIDWSQEVDPERGFVADELIDIYDSSFWHKMNSKEKAEMNRLVSA